MKELAQNLVPNSSALFVLVRKANPDRVLEKLQGTGGKILKTSLSHEDEAKLQAALAPDLTSGVHLIPSCSQMTVYPLLPSPHACGGRGSG